MSLIKLFEYTQEICGNLHNKKIKINNIEWSYYDNNKVNKPVIIIFHGFQSNKKYTWYSLLKKLKNNFRIIIPDMIGHGDTKIISNDNFDFSTTNTIIQLKLFIDSIIGKNKQFHLIGSSLGGLYACIMSANYPISVISLTLYSTFGINNNNLLLDIYNKTNINLLVPNNVNELLLRNEIIFYNKIPLNKLLVNNYLLDIQKKHYDSYIKILNQTIIPDNNILKKYIKIIKQPLLIIWGKYDKILDISSINYLKNNLIKKPEIHILDKCGHLVHYEYPDICAKLTKFHILRSINNL